MDNRDSCSLDKVKMDANTVWQWRIMHVKRYSGYPEPFHHSSKIGLDFNVKANTKKKLDFQLVTNGVILEICDFAEAINKGEKYFITDILENNFSLGLENEQQRIDFTTRLQHKVKDLLRNPPGDEHEVFTLFDSSECTSDSNSGLNKASADSKTDSVMVEMDDTKDGKQCSQATSRENKKTESHSEEMDEVQKSKCSGEQSTKELKEDVPSVFPHCEEIGLNLGIGAKQSLDLGLLTKGVMLELVHLTRMLTASKSQIILDVLDHNFDLDLKNNQAKNQVWSHVSQLLERRRQVEDEPFSFQSMKRPRGSALSNVGVKRLRRGQSEHKEKKQFSHYINVCTYTKTEADHDHSSSCAESDSDEVTPGNTTSQYHTENPRNTNIPTESKSSVLGIDQSSCSHTMNSEMNPTVASQQEGRWLCVGNEQTQTPTTNVLNDCDIDHEEMETENYSICPVGESDLDSNVLPDSGKSDIEDHLKNSKSGYLCLDVSRSSESSSHGDAAHFHNFTDVSSNVQTMNSNMDPPLDTAKQGLCVEQNQNPRSTANTRDTEQEQMEIARDMWKLRANRVEQILSAKWKHTFPFSRRCGLTFNVGFGPKRNISIESLSNSLLLEIAEFALEINASQKDFMMEILDYNFDLSLQNQQHRDIFACKIITRVGQLRSCEGAVKIANGVFELPGFIPELSSISRMERCDSMQLPQAESEELTCISIKDVVLYPCCHKIGLKLHVNNNQLRKKLDINQLTNGAMTEVTNFAEKLCGTFEQIFLDILEHNFDLDLQSGDSDCARNILAQIPAAVAQMNQRTCQSRRIKKIEGTIKGVSNKKLDFKNNPNLASRSDGSCQGAIIDQNAGGSVDADHKNQLDLELWKLRANHIQRILSIPHEEHCPLYSYSRCKKLGIDFNVGSGVKQNLDPKLLTNGIMVEFHTFATAILSAKKYFITEILEYNFNLELKNELYRSAFGQQIVAKFDIMNKSRDRNIMPFELPDVKCMQEPTHDKTIYCPKCSQDRNHGLHEDEFGVNRMHHHHTHALTDTVSVDAKGTAQKPATGLLSTFSTIEETIMDSYPLCKKIGLNLCVDQNQPKEKLCQHVLTFEAMKEVTNFAKGLCGSLSKIIHTLLKHYFNVVSPNVLQMFQKAIAQRGRQNSWYDEVFVFQPVSLKPPGQLIKVKRQSVSYRNERKAVMRERQLALHGKQERQSVSYRNERKGVMRERQPTLHGKQEKATPPSNDMRYPICTEIGLKLDVTRKLVNKEKLDLKLLTRAVVFEIHEFASQKVGHYYPRTVFDILDCNFDLSSQHYRCWEFSTAIASKIQTMVKQYCKNYRADEVFKLPFLFDLKASEGLIKNYQVGNVDQEELDADNYYTCPLGESDLDSDEVTDSEDAGYQYPSENPEAFSLSSDIASESESNCQATSVHLHNSHDDSSSLPPFACQFDGKNTCGDDKQTQTPRYAPDDCDMEQEESGTENLWKFRANRVEQILSAIKEFGPFKRSKKAGIEFNVGFGPRQNLSKSLTAEYVLLEIAEFALAINSSQQDFIMEILEYNFDLGLQSQQRRNMFITEIMNRVRQLSSCEDKVKFSHEIFELPVSMPAIIMANQKEGSVVPELSNISKMEKCDVAFMHPSHSETTGMSHKSEDLDTCCKEIGLELHVNYSKPRTKLDINKLTNGAMTEVTNFAEKLCGTFEQICLDIIRHNLSCDLQSEDSDLAMNFLSQIPAAIEHKNLRAIKTSKIWGTSMEIPTMEKLNSQSNPNLGSGSAGLIQIVNLDQNGGCSTDIESKNELELELWKLRANHIKRILSIPHEEYCPLYSYSRCKKLGIDFNVGSGVKQNLERKLLTNGIMVEFHTFATALLSAKRHFITEILEYNFNLNLKNELDRNAFGLQILLNLPQQTNKKHLLERLFKLPDMRSIPEPTVDRSYCPKCYVDRNYKVRQYESAKACTNHSVPHALSDTVSANENCTAEQLATDPSSTLSKIEKTIIDSYPRCKKIGLSLCVDTDKPKDKLDPRVLTRRVLNEVICFALILCGRKNKIIHELVEHNFKTDPQHQDLDMQQLFSSVKALKKDGDNWFNEVFVTQLIAHRQPGNVSKTTQESSTLARERKETVQKRRLALKSVEEKATQPCQNARIAKSKRKNPNKRNCFPICTEIGLDLDVTSKSGEKEKLDLNLLTTSVLIEINKFALKKAGGYFPSTFFDILDYNFDISSQHYRRWEFSLAAASKAHSVLKKYRYKREDNVFELPFVFPDKNMDKDKKRQKEKSTFSKKEPHKTRNRGDKQEVGFHLGGDSIRNPNGVDTNQSTIFKTHPWTTKRQININEHQVAVGSSCPLQGNMYRKQEYELSCGNMTQQPHQHDFAKQESNFVENGTFGESGGTLGYPLTSMCSNLESNITPKLKNEGVHYYTLADSPRSEGRTLLSACTHAESNIKREPDTAEYLNPLEVAAALGYTMVTIGDASESAVIKEEQEYVLVDPYSDDVVLH